MGYLKDQTVEIEVNGKKVRVFKLEAEKVKAGLAKLEKQGKNAKK